MIAEPQCSIRKCRHFGGVYQPDGSEMTEVVVCPAFPHGIPDEIAYGRNKHRELYPRQTWDYVFEAGSRGDQGFCM